MSLASTVVFIIILAVSGHAELPRIGLSLPSLEPRIVGGKNTVPGQFPYQVSLQWGLPPIVNYQHFCGGSIVNNKWILTAGHCIKAVPEIGTFIIKAGKYNISKEEVWEQKVEVKRAFIHENYTGGVAPYDIALIQLTKPLLFNKNISNVDLPNDNTIEIGNSILSGWGSISSTSHAVMPDILQYVNLPLITLNSCKKAIENLVGPSPLHVTNICTGPLFAGISACNGDSGGPLVKNQDNKTQLIGIVSWGIMPCGTLGAPSVYTRTSAFVNWIKTTITNNT